MNSPSRHIAISGLGSIGRQHAQAIRSSNPGEVVGFDPDPSLCASALRQDLVDRVHSSFDDLLAEEPDALIVAAPDFAHLTQLSSAAERGICVLVEKPLADDLSAARTVIPQVEATCTPVLVGYVLRHARVIQETRELILDGAIGTPTSFQVMLGAYDTIAVTSSRFSQPQSNRLYRDYSHEWDYLNWLFGPIDEVFATARTTATVDHLESPNIVDGLISTRSGALGSFHIDYVAQRGVRLLTVIGTHGNMIVDVGAGSITLRPQGDDDRVIEHPGSAASALARQAEHLLSVSAGQATPQVTLTDGMAALEVAEALISSAESHTWVQPEIQQGTNQ